MRTNAIRSSLVNRLPPESLAINAARKASRDLCQLVRGALGSSTLNGFFFESHVAKSRKSTLIGKRTELL